LGFGIRLVFILCILGRLFFGDCGLLGLLRCGTHLSGGGLGFTFAIAFGKPLLVAIESHADRQGENFRCIGTDQAVDDQLSEQLPKMIDVPNRLREETVVIREVVVANGVTGNNQVGNVAMPDRENSAGHQPPKSMVAELGKNRGEHP